jgi:hypothetical protein
MKKVLISLMVVSTLFIMGMTIETVQSPSIRSRTGIAANDTPAAVTARKFANLPSHTFKIDRPWNTVELTVLCSHTVSNQTAILEVWAARSDGEMTMVFVSGTLTEGAQVSVADGNYVDTGTITTDVWPAGVTVSDGGGADRVTKFTFDAMGYEYLVCYIKSRSAGTWAVRCSGY